MVKYTLFFDGSSKGITGVLSVRRGEGVIFDPKGTKQTKFAWEIGISTNNEAGDLTLYEGLLILINKLV